MADQPPKVFISYSWTSQQHQMRVKDWADRLMADGIEVILDIYDLKEGNDKFAFMERMVTDNSVSHVLAICDKTYATKADARKAGVGTESQIISKEVYDKIEQSKFIPITCEFEPDGSPFLPAFFKARIWIDFSSDESVNENWEQLVRLLYGKPLHVKPRLGKPPTFLSDDTNTPSNPIAARYATLKQAVLHAKPGLSILRSEFLDACVEFVDSLRVRKAPNPVGFDTQVITDCGKLKQARNHIVDWVMLESSLAPASDFSEHLIWLLEKLRESKTRPEEITTWNDSWFDAHVLFVYETFIYIIAALLKNGRTKVLHELFITHYLLPEREWKESQRFDRFDGFYGYSAVIGAALGPEGRRYIAPSAELIRRQADRQDLPFNSLIEAELLLFLMALITPDTRWYPGTFHYAGYSRSFPLFVRATQHKGFIKLAEITGIENAEAVRDAITNGRQRMAVEKWNDFQSSGSLFAAMNIEHLDTLR